MSEDLYIARLYYNRTHTLCAAEIFSPYPKLCSTYLHEKGCQITKKACYAQYTCTYPGISPLPPPCFVHRGLSCVVCSASSTIESLLSLFAHFLCILKVSTKYKCFAKYDPMNIILSQRNRAVFLHVSFKKKS